jgi:hypothetical protein
MRSAGHMDSFSRATRWYRRVLIVCLAAASVAVLAPCAAQAGTYSVQLGIDPTGCVASDYFAPGMSGEAYCANPALTGLDGWGIYPDSPTVAAGSAGQWQVNAPAGVAISEVTLPSVTSSGLGSSGWQAGDYWDGGSTVWAPGTTTVNEGGLNSSYYGFKLYCEASSCNNQGYLQVSEVSLVASEGTGPTLLATGGGNLWYEGSQYAPTTYVWNPAGDPWSLALSGSDASGVCNLDYEVTGYGQVASPDASRVTDSFTQCPDPLTWGATLDTDTYVPPGSHGSIGLTISGTNAAGVTTPDGESVLVDNVQPSVTLSTPNDSNPSGWSVNRAVTVDAVGSAGPSGLSSLTCTIDGGKPEPYPSAGLTVDGNGQHKISCTAANGAVGPQGQPNTSTSTMSVDIDEQPPSLSIEPQNPSSPAQVVADTSDSESQVASGEIEIAPKGTSNWTVLPTTFASNGQLVATIPDAGLSGPYTVQAVACSQVGNCGSTSETLTMPLRITAQSDVSFDKIAVPAKVVHERVLVDWHYKRERRHGKTVRVRVGGHYRTIRVVIDRNASCATKRVKTGRRRWKEIKVCRTLKLKVVRHEQVRYGRTATVHGVLVSGQGVPIDNAPVQIWTAPDNGSNRFSQVASETTSSDGAWQVKLRAGPSRLVQARYPGTATILPAIGQVTLTVPAKIRIVSITPRHVAWGGTVNITAELDGGYLPSSGELVELLYGYGRSKAPYGVKTHVTARRFTTSFTFGPGQTPVTFKFQVRALPDPAYAFSAASSNTVDVRVGGSASSSSSLPSTSKKHHKPTDKKKAKKHHTAKHKKAVKHRKTKHKKKARRR